MMNRPDTEFTMFNNMLYVYTYTLTYSALKVPEWNTFYFISNNVERRE